MIPIYRDEFAIPIEPVHETSRTFKYFEDSESDKSHCFGEVDGLEAVRQAVFHIVNTERYDYEINPHSYGIEKRQFIGESFNYFRARIENVVREAVMQDDRVRDVRILSVDNPAPAMARAFFEVESIFGSFESSVEALLS